MAESVSQLQAKLLALTHGKVNIMADAETFKNTTEILREMSQAWQDMNDIERASALELMGGKRQANILSSLITNFQTVEDVIATAADSEGSALAENAKWMDSIEGKTITLKNSMQTLWNDTLNSDVVKFFLDVANAIVKVADSFGLLPTAAGIFTTYKIASKGLKEAFDSTSVSTKQLKQQLSEYLTQQTSATTATNEAAAASMTNATATMAEAEASTAASGAKAEEAMSDQIEGQMSLFDAEANQQEMMASNAVTDAKAREAIQLYETTDADQIEGQMSLFAADANQQQAAGNTTSGLGSSVGIFSKMASGAAKAGTAVKVLFGALGKGLLVMAGLKVATWLLGKAWDWIDNAIHRAEKLKEEVEELEKTYKEAKKTFDDNLTSLTTSSDTKVYATLADEFSALTKGVDQYGNNISLTSDKYERYKAICEKIVGIQPSIAAGYDDATEAIGNNANALAQLIELQKYQQRQTVDEFISDENLGKQAENAANELKAAKTKQGYSELTKITLYRELNDAIFENLPEHINNATGITTKDANENGLFDDEIMEYILKRLGYTQDQINDIIASYWRENGDGTKGFWSQDFIFDYYDEIISNVDKFNPQYQKIITDGAANVEKTILAANKGVEEAQNELVDTFLQVPQGSDAGSYYDQLNNASKKFITDWIKNSSQFKIDANETEEAAVQSRDNIIQMVQNLASEDFKIDFEGEQITGQEFLDQFYNLDPTTVNWEDYKTKKQALLDTFWKQIGGEENDYGVTYEDLKVSFGIEFIDDASEDNQKAKEVKSQVAQKIGKSEAELQKWLNTLPASKVQKFYEIDWNYVGDLNSFTDVENEIDKQLPTETISVKAYSTLSSAVEDFNEVQKQTDEIVADNTEVTKDYKDSLTALGFTQEELNECFDESNPLLVKNAALLRKLVVQKKADQQATVRMAKAQTQLQYKNTVKQLGQVVKAMQQEYAANSKVSDATLKTVGVLRSQLTALKQTIQQYAILELQLTDAANAYNEFEAAKNRDSELSYGDSMVEMLEVINEGFKTGKVGSEAFQAAVKALVPESVYKDIDDLEDRMIAIHDYIDKNSVFADYFTIDDDGKFSITYDNMKAFIQDGLKDGVGEEFGVFTGTLDDFELSDDIQSVKDLADAYGITEAAALAMLSTFEQYDASWGNIITDLTTTPLDRKINEATDALDEALDAQEEFINSGKSIKENQDEWDQLQANVDTATKALNEATTAAADNAKKTVQVGTYYDYLNGKISLTDAEVQALAKSLGLVDENGQPLIIVNDDGSIQETGNGLQKLNEQKENLKKTSIMDIQANYDEVRSQIDELKSYRDHELTDEERNEVKVKFGLKEGSDEEIDAKIAELTAEQKEIEFTYKITSTTEEQETGAIEKLQDWETNGMTFSVNAQTDEAKGKIDELNTEKDKLSEPETTQYEVTGTGYNTVSQIDSYWDDITGDKETNYTVNENRNVTISETEGVKISGADGTAHAQGSWGVSKNETALVGELGPELLVRDGHWTTIGTNGAEFTNIKKGDIIFNHKQTEELLKNGYVTGRGRAYANGTSDGSNSLLDRMKRIVNSNKLNQLAEYAEEMCKQYEELTNGNVDLRKRPHLSPSYEHELAMSGGYNSFIGTDGEIYASTSAETMTIGEGENQYTIDITPVLENGEVLTSDSLAEYVDNLVTDGSMQDLLDSDKYNLIIHAVPGEYNEKDWSGFEDQLSKYKDGYLDTILHMFNLGGEEAVETYGFSSVGLADVSRDLQNNGSYDGKEVASAIDDTSEGMRNLDELINQYVTDVLNAKSLADEIGTDLSKTQYGNVDTDTRQKLYWDEESIDKYSDALDSWGIKAEEIIGTYSTLLSVYSNFDGVDIAFSPMLQTEDGPQLLDSNTVHKYIWGLIDKASKDDGKWTNEELFQLDTEGFELNGTVVKNLLEDIGESANTTAKLLHYVGDTGAISSLEGEIETTASELVTTGENISDVQAKLDLLNATNISDKTFTVTPVYQTIGSGKEETVRTPGGSGRYTKYAYANGTVHADRNAYSNGNFGAPKTETALVGELGPEMLVRNGRWTTVGDNGAEFTQVKKGDIIFNHKQTEELLKNGYVTGRGKMVGGAFANGTINKSNGPAYDYGMFGGYVGDNDVFKNGSDAWMELWTNTANDLSDAASDLSDATDEFEEVFDWVAVRLEEIDETLDLLDARLQNAADYRSKNGIIDSMIGINEKKISNLTAGIQEYSEYAAKLLSEVPVQYRDAVQNGTIAIEEFAGEADEATLKAIENYREWAQKVADLRKQLEETKTTIRDLAIEKFDNAYKSGDVRATVEDSQTKKLQNRVDYDEERGLITSDAYYLAMMENSNKKIEYLTNAREAMQKELDDGVKSGAIVKGSDEWYELIDQMYQIDAQIDEATIELEQFQNAINDIYWDNFDELINRLDYMSDETQNLIDLMGEADMVTKPEGRTYEGGTVKFWTADDVQWTEEGIASLGLYAQQMEIAEYKAKQYAEAIDDLTKDYQDGKYSESEYLEKLNELKDGQYNAIQSYYDAQDAIKKLNQTRIDSIKNGIEKEIDAYEELINKKKEELSAEKDLYDFQKSTAEQQKNIADIQRKLAALSGDNSASAIAQRKKLEAELAEAQAELEDSYYQRSIDDRSNALDKEFEDFQDEKNAEIEKWEEYLENIEQVVADSLGIVQANASGVYDTLSAKAEEYNLTLSNAIMTPWQDGALAVSDYQSTFDTAMSSTTDQLEALKNSWQEVIDKMAEAGNQNVADINQENANYAAATYTEPEKPSQPSAPSNPTPEQKAPPSVGSTVTVKKSATHFSTQSGSARMASFVPGGSYQVMQVGINGDKSQILIGKNGQYTGWVWLKDLEGYAKGTTGVKKSGFAITDEDNLEELVLHAGPDGRLQYLTKGSSVLTSELTDRLMDLAMNPQDMLDRNRPEIKLSPEVHNTEINLDISYGDMLHIEEFNGDDPDEIAKIVAKQFEKHTRDLNNALRKYVR